MTVVEQRGKKLCGALIQSHATASLSLIVVYCSFKNTYPPSNILLCNYSLSLSLSELVTP